MPIPQAFPWLASVRSRTKIRVILGLLGFDGPIESGTFRSHSCPCRRHSHSCPIRQQSRYRSVRKEGEASVLPCFSEKGFSCSIICCGLMSSIEGRFVKRILKNPHPKKDGEFLQNDGTHSVRTAGKPCLIVSRWTIMAPSGFPMPITIILIRPLSNSPLKSVWSLIRLTTMILSAFRIFLSMRTGVPNFVLPIFQPQRRKRSEPPSSLP